MTEATAATARAALMTREERVQRALGARAEQGFPVGIEDDDALEFIADICLSAARTGTAEQP